MEKPNYKNTQGEHPIPHAKGITEKDNRNPKSVEVNNDAKNEEE